MVILELITFSLQEKFNKQFDIFLIGWENNRKEWNQEYKKAMK